MATVQKWGNSLGIRIPRDIAEDLGLSEGKQVTVRKQGDALTVRPVKIPRYSLKELLKDMKTPLKITREDREWLDFPPMGKEVM